MEYQAFTLTHPLVLPNDHQTTHAGVSADLAETDAATGRGAARAPRSTSSYGTRHPLLLHAQFPTPAQQSDRQPRASS